MQRGLEQYNALSVNVKEVIQSSLYSWSVTQRISSCNVLQLTIQPIVGQCNRFSKLLKSYMTLNLLAVNLILQVQRQLISLSALSYKARGKQGLRIRPNIHT